MPYFFILTIVFIAWIQLEKSKSNKSAKKEAKSFWEREAQANFVRKQDISQLNYISVPLDALPLDDFHDQELLDLQEQIKVLAGQKILNLSGYTNTDLKLAYGTSNLAVLSQYEENYTFLIATLLRYGTLLEQHKEYAKAKQVLEFAITCDTDLSGNYILLATLYAKDQQPQKIHDLIITAGNLKSLSRHHILNTLETILTSSCHAPK